MTSSGLKPASRSSSIFLDVAEAVEVVDVTAVAADRDDAAAILVLVDELHPQPVVLAPRHLALGRPVEPVRAVIGAARAVPVPQHRQRVFLVPLRAAHAHEVAAG